MANHGGHHQLLQEFDMLAQQDLNARRDDAGTDWIVEDNCAFCPEQTSRPLSPHIGAGNVVGLYSLSLGV